jgi:hypothetical protein
MILHETSAFMLVGLKFQLWAGMVALSHSLVISDGKVLVSIHPVIQIL